MMYRMTASPWGPATTAPTSSTPTSARARASSSISTSTWRAASGPSMPTTTWQNSSTCAGAQSPRTSKCVGRSKAELLKQSLFTMFSVFLINWISCYGRVIYVCRNVQKQKKSILKISYKTQWQQRWRRWNGGDRGGKRLLIKESKSVTQKQEEYKKTTGSRKQMSWLNYPQTAHHRLRSSRLSPSLQRPKWRRRSRSFIFSNLWHFTQLPVQL